MPDTQFTLLKSVLIFLGAGSGGLLRYWLGGIVQNWWGPTFPLGTLVVNITGCLAIGFLATAWSGPVLIREEYRQGVLIGIIGGYTTFSSFGRETLALVHDGEASSPAPLREMASAGDFLEGCGRTCRQGRRSTRKPAHQKGVATGAIFAGPCFGPTSCSWGVEGEVWSGRGAASPAPSMWLPWSDDKTKCVNQVARPRR